MRGRTVYDAVLSFAHIFGVARYEHFFKVLIPEFTRSEKYVYRVIGELAAAGRLRIEGNGKGKLIKAKDYRRRQVAHDLGVNDIQARLVSACHRLGYPAEPYFLPLNGWRPDGVWGFLKDQWRLVGIEYQKTPLTERRWRNKFKTIRVAINGTKTQVYTLVAVESESDWYLAALARRADHVGFYFAGKGEIDRSDNILTDAIWCHPFAQGKVPIFYKDWEDEKKT